MTLKDAKNNPPVAPVKETLESGKSAMYNTNDRPSSHNSSCTRYLEPLQQFDNQKEFCYCIGTTLYWLHKQLH